MSNRRLHVAEVAPPFFQVPPDGYGGIESVVAMLVDGLVARGHKVTLIGAGDHQTQAEFLATFEEPQTERVGDPMVELTHAARVDALLEDLDVDLVHDHSTPGPILARGRNVPVVITSHGPAGQWSEYLQAVDQLVHLVGISESQKALCPDLSWQAVVHNAVDTSGIPMNVNKGDDLVWIGRMSPDKGAHIAIDLARRADRRIVLAAKCTEPQEEQYFDEYIQPRLGSDVDWRGEVGPPEKFELLGQASAFLFPLQWNEPFGMVVLEAMACGTPVVSLKRGAIPELVLDGVTGFLREEPEELPETFGRLKEIDPLACRARVEEHFNSELMVERYERLFLEIVNAQRTASAAQNLQTTQ